MKDFTSNIIVLLDTFIYKFGYLEYINSNSKFESPYYYYKSKYNIDKKLLKLKYYEFKKKILKNNNKYNFLFSGDGYIKDPKDLNKLDLNNIYDLIKDNNCYYSKLANLIYKKNSGDLDIGNLFLDILSVDKNNIHIKLEYIRFKGSSLYKKNNRDVKYINSSVLNLFKIIKELEKKKIMLFTFIYSWLGYLLIEKKLFSEGILYFDKTIYINKKNNFYCYEPFFWKALALNKNKNFEKSLFNCNFILINKIDLHKCDFRFYRLLGDNYFNLGDYKNFYINLKKCINKYLDTGSFHFDNNLILHFDNNLLLFNNVIEKNKYDAFLKYTKKYRRNELDNIIFSIAYLYKEQLLGNSILFNDSRGIELLCYNYLQLIYEGKIK